MQHTSTPATDSTQTKECICEKVLLTIPDRVLALGKITYVEKPNPEST